MSAIDRLAVIIKGLQHHYKPIDKKTNLKCMNIVIHFKNFVNLFSKTRQPLWHNENTFTI
jgi:hypothetical protein